MTFDGRELGPVPAAVIARTVKRYAVSDASPSIVIGLLAPLAVAPPGDAVTMNDVIGKPPVFAGAVKLTMALPLPGVAATVPGAPGSPRGTTTDDGKDACPSPATDVAVTVNVYGVPFARPVTTSGLFVPDTEAPPGDARTVYDVIGLVPSDAGVVKLIVACVSPADADTAIGALGGVGRPEVGLTVKRVLAS
jgi:hypothetical protein